MTEVSELLEIVVRRKEQVFQSMPMSLPDGDRRRLIDSMTTYGTVTYWLTVGICAAIANEVNYRSQVAIQRAELADASTKAAPNGIGAVLDHPLLPPLVP